MAPFDPGTEHPTSSALPDAPANTIDEQGKGKYQCPNGHAFNNYEVQRVNHDTVAKTCPEDGYVFEQIPLADYLDTQGARGVLE